MESFCSWVKPSWPPEEVDVHHREGEVEEEDFSSTSFKDDNDIKMSKSADFIKILK